MWKGSSPLCNFLTLGTPSGSRSTDTCEAVWKQYADVCSTWAKMIIQHIQHISHPNSHEKIHLLSLHSEMLADRRRGIRDSQLGILGAAWPKKTSETEWTQESPGVTQAGIKDFKTLFFEVEKLQQSLVFDGFLGCFWLIFWLVGL